MQPTPIVRPSWLSLHRTSLLGLLTMVGIGAAGVAYLDRTGPPAPTIVTSVPAIVPVPITTPAPQVTVTVPPPPEPPAPERVSPRLLAPYLDSRCVLLDPGAETPAGDPCGFGDGLPAISADGTTLAIAHYPGDGGRGFTHMAMRFVDVTTSKVLREDPIVASDELDQDGHATVETETKVERRLAALTKRLAGYRSLQALEHHPADAPPAHGLYIVEAASREGLLRIIDTDAGAVLLQEQFDVTDEYPARTVDPDSDPGCYPSHVQGIGAWWDARTRTLLADVSFTGGPCYCDNPTHSYVRRAP